MDSKVTNQLLLTGAILDNQKAMEYKTQTGTLQCNFTFVQLKKFKRTSERRAAEIVKFALPMVAGGGMNVSVQVVCVYALPLYNS